MVGRSNALPRDVGNHLAPMGSAENVAWILSLPMRLTATVVEEYLRNGTMKQR
jgi:hypothetical protein